MRGGGGGGGGSGIAQRSALGAREPATHWALRQRNKLLDDGGVFADEALAVVVLLAVEVDAHVALALHLALRRRAAGHDRHARAHRADVVRVRAPPLDGHP